MTNPVIEVRGLQCRYGDFVAVRGVDLDVRRGELFALLGTNGAGKTTTLETLEGFRAADGGTARVLDGDPARDRRRLRPRTGIMLQESGFAGDLTTLETIELWRSLSSRSFVGAELLGAVDLTHRSDVAVVQLSGGERRRLDLALAIAGAPELLFLDEPTTGLDPQSRHRMWELIRRLQDDGATVVLTTHYLEEAEALADRVAIMDTGSIAVTGSVAEVVGSRPARIAFDEPAAALPDLPGVVEKSVDVDGRIVLRTTALQRDLTALLEWAAAVQVELVRLEAGQASLDDVFRELS